MSDAPTVRLARPSEPLPDRARVAPILVVDPGPRTGWAVLWGPDGLASGVQAFGEGEPARRAVRFRQWLRSLLELSEPALVVHVRPQVRGARNETHRGRAAAHQLHGVLLAEVEGRFDHVEATLRRVERHAGADPVGAARARWGATVDEAEAWALCALAWAVDEYVRAGPT